MADLPPEALRALINKLDKIVQETQELQKLLRDQMRERSTRDKLLNGRKSAAKKRKTFPGHDS